MLRSLPGLAPACTPTIRVLLNLKKVVVQRGAFRAELHDHGGMGLRETLIQLQRGLPRVLNQAPGRPCFPGNCPLFLPPFIDPLAHLPPGRGGEPDHGFPGLPRAENLLLTSVQALQCGQFCFMIRLLVSLQTNMRGYLLDY